MSLAGSRPIVAIPGPSPVPDRVLRAMHRVSPDIYGEDLASANAALMDGLRWLAGTRGKVAAFIGNGHAAWEAASANLLSPGDAVLVLVSGRFGEGWAELLRAQGIAVEVMDCEADAPDPSRLAARLAEDRARAIRAVCVCQIDTASSVQADIAALRQAMGDHPALLMVDAIASLGCAPMRMDDWGVDVLLAASQKGLMCPPGCCFLWLSDRAAAMPATPLTSPWWDMRPRLRADQLWQFWGGTPPVQHIFGLTEALAIMREEGLEQVWARHRALADCVAAAFECWAAGGDIALSVVRPQARAASVTAVRLAGADALRGWLELRAGLTLGIGLGAADPANALRVAHMGDAGAVQVLGVLAAMQAGMAALGIAHGPGALDAAAAVVAVRA
ncbi:MAG: aminotransferase class V-fold PLP-dependent enzyme [Paracoccus sp. (in: a-proteobacteria)]|uniref:pyridoxal-phosphate-dependent aminotransferase family protein n=1 Tax=Paracoccus sp. TaxID=267 RepID=UPI0026DEB3DE|nr:aminotransferase class V-fold PLP-dependent enzyme [Paracoccus sp. (in: a-proteobacteria)]MDO5631744.1 aminotransferase class V-fold PLP-dependent enzyme [Paracoccus sp. (in: a-proteobacteria)]